MADSFILEQIMSNSYFVISRCEDDMHGQVCTKEDVAKMFNEGDYDGYRCVQPQDVKKVLSRLDSFPSHSVLVIKGEVIVPTPKDIVKTWEIG